MDLCGPLPITENGNVYILIIVNVCTKYIIARPLRNKQSDTVMKALIQVFGDYGLCYIRGYLCFPTLFSKEFVFKINRHAK